MRKAEMMGFAEIVRQETTIKQRMIVSHAKELKDLNDSYLKQLGDQLNRVDQVGTILLRRTETETVEDAARRVMAELAERQNPTKFDEKLFREIGELRILEKAYDEALKLCDEDDITPAEQIKRMRVQIEALNNMADDHMRSAGTWKGFVERIQRRLKPKQDESPEDTIERWLNDFDNEMGKSLVEAGRKLDELENANQGLRTEVAALQEKLRASIQRADFAQIEADRLKAQNVTTPKGHPVKEGEWVSKDWKQAAQVVEVDAEHAKYKIRFVGSKVVEVWSFGHCKPCDPPTLEAFQAHHDRVVEHMQDEATRLGQLLTATESERDSLRTEVTMLRTELDTEKGECIGLKQVISFSEGEVSRLKKLLNASDSERENQRNAVAHGWQFAASQMLAAVMPAVSPDWPSVHNKTDFEWALSQVKAEIERLRSYLVKPEAEQADDYLRTQLVRLGSQRDHLLFELEKERREVRELRTRSELAAQSFARHTGWVHLKASKQTPRHGEAAQILAFIVHYEGSERRWDATLCEPCAPPDETEVIVPGPDAP